jgi:hypothetical protein
MEDGDVCGEKYSLVKKLEVSPCPQHCISPKEIKLYCRAYQRLLRLECRIVTS